MDQGKCFICGSLVSSRSITKHIKNCIAKKYGKATAAEDIPENGTYLLKVQGRFQMEYYLYLLVDSCVLLSELDRYLRDIWLECCGHLSSFRIDGEEYVSDSGSEWSQEEGMDIEAGDVLDVGTSFSYTYDFGSSTELTLKVAGVYEPLEEEKGIRLAGRNTRIDYSCKFCDNEAVALYQDPMDGAQGMVCGKCMDKMQAEDDELYFSDPVNSPRAGVCGYDRSADDILFMKHKK